MKNKTTFLKNFAGMFFIAFSLFSVAAKAQTTIFTEDFSSITAGNNTSTNGSSNQWTGNDNFPSEDIFRAYQAGGAVKLGASGGIGYITTLPLDLSQSNGEFTLSFDVKGWSTLEGNIKVTVTGIEEEIVTYTAVLADDFETKTISFTGGTADATIRIETTAKRAFIDNVVVTVPELTVDAPVATAATSITAMSFTANWEAVEGIDIYLLDVSTNENFTDFVEGYENMNVATTSQIVEDLDANTTYYYRVFAAGNGIISESSNIIEVMTICGEVTAPVAEEEIEICISGTVADLMPAGEGIQWFTTETGGVALADDEVLVNGTYYVSATVDGCESTRVAVEVEIETPVVPTGEAEQNFTEGQTLADLVVVVEEDAVWYADEALTTELPLTTVLVDETTYYVVSDDEGCTSDAFAVTVNATLSNPSFGMESLTYFPNPVKDVFTVTNTEAIATVTVYNMLGQAVVVNNANAQTAQVNMAALTAGTYFVKVVSGANTKTIQVVKQ